MLGYLKANVDELIWTIVFSGLSWHIIQLVRRIHSKKQDKFYLKNDWKYMTLNFNGAFIYVMTLFGRSVKREYRFEFRPLSSHIIALRTADVELILQILVNIFMYIPIGILLPTCFSMFKKKRRVLFLVFCISSLIEIIQGIARLGYFEADDIINNVFGSIIGLGIYTLCIKLQPIMLIKYNKQ